MSMQGDSSECEYRGGCESFEETKQPVYINWKEVGKTRRKSI